MCKFNELFSGLYTFWLFEYLISQRNILGNILYFCIGHFCIEHLFRAVEMKSHCLRGCGLEGQN